MIRTAALLAFLLCLGGLFFFRERLGNPIHQESGASSMHIKHRYLVVSIEAPADWVKKHRFTITWQGNPVSLPVAFRLRGAAEKVELGAGPEQLRYLDIGKDKIPVEAQPDTDFRVGNEPGVAFLPETSPRAGVVALSLATWVVVCPRGQQGEVSPLAHKEELLRDGGKVGMRLKELLAEGRVIDVKPDE